MNNLIIEASEDTPGIFFDATSGVLEISGKSFPDNVFSFYDPVLVWLNQYINTPSQATIVLFKLDYFNTATAKIIFDIFSILDTIHDQGRNVKISWHYKNDDDDMREAGEGYKDIIKTTIELVSY